MLAASNISSAGALGMRGEYELQSKLLKGCYIRDYIGNYYGAY